MVKISKSMFQGFFRAKSYPACQFDLSHQHVFLIFKFLPLSLSKKWAKNVLFTWSDLYLKGTGLKYQLWPETAKQGLPFVNQAQDNTLWISILLTHSLKHKVQIIKSCSFKMIFFCSFQAPTAKHYIFWSWNSTEILRKAHEYSLSCQQIRCFKILVMILLVLKNKSWKKSVENSTFG